jgi:hypothetical protein
MFPPPGHRLPLRSIPVRRVCLAAVQTTFWRFVFVQQEMGQGNPNLLGVPTHAPPVASRTKILTSTSPDLLFIFDGVSIWIAGWAIRETYVVAGRGTANKLSPRFTQRCIFPLDLHKAKTHRNSQRTIG